MQTIRVLEKTGKDGVLSLRIPLGRPDAEYEVVIVAQPAGAATTPEERGWPPGYFDRTFGSITDETFERAPQGELPALGPGFGAGMIYLLDTNVCIQYLRGRNVLVRQRLAAKPLSEIRLCTVVMAELYIGALRSAKPAANRADVDVFAGPYTSLPFDLPAADVHAQIRLHLETLGMTIGPYDLQIAAIALTHGCTLVTHNTAEFSRVPGLPLEDWELP